MTVITSYPKDIEIYLLNIHHHISPGNEAENGKPNVGIPRSCNCLGQMWKQETHKTKGGRDREEQGKNKKMKEMSLKRGKEESCV